MVEVLNRYEGRTFTHLFAPSNLEYRSFFISGNKRGIARIKEKFRDIPHRITPTFLEYNRKQHAQKYEFDFFGDSVDAEVTIDSGTVHAPDSAACLVLLFADPKVGAVTEDIKSIRKNFGGREKCLEQKKEQLV